MPSDAPVGVVAATYDRAREVIAELGLTNARPLSARVGARGTINGALIVDDTALPLSERARAELLPTLIGTGGTVFELRRAS